MVNSGKNFERLTEEIYNKLIRDRRFEKVERNVRIKGPDGDRQIDILLTASTMGLEIRTIVECRDHLRKVDVEYLDSVESKMRDVKANKAVIVSRAGFTSGALSKARRLNITLCTAHEASNPNWGIDVEVPVVVHELAPISIQFDADFKEITTSDFTFYKDRFLINDLDIYSLIQEKWNNGQLGKLSINPIQEVFLSEISPPFYIKDKNGDKIYFKEVKILLESKVTTYLGNLKEVGNTQLLKNITENTMTFFIDQAPIRNYRNEFRRLAEGEMPTYTSLSVVIATTLQIVNIEGTHVDFKK